MDVLASSSRPKEPAWTSNATRDPMEEPVALKRPPQSANGGPMHLGAIPKRNCYGVSYHSLATSDAMSSFYALQPLSGGKSITLAREGGLASVSYPGNVPAGLTLMKSNNVASNRLQEENQPINSPANADRLSRGGVPFSGSTSRICGYVHFPPGRHVLNSDDSSTPSEPQLGLASQGSPPIDDDLNKPDPHESCQRCSNLRLFSCFFLGPFQALVAVFVLLFPLHVTAFTIALINCCRVELEMKPSIANVYLSQMEEHKGLAGIFCWVATFEFLTAVLLLPLGKFARKRDRKGLISSGIVLTVARLGLVVVHILGLIVIVATVRKHAQKEDTVAQDLQRLKTLYLAIMVCEFTLYLVVGYSLHVIYRQSKPVEVNKVNKA